MEQEGGGRDRDTRGTHGGRTPTRGLWDTAAGSCRRRGPPPHSPSRRPPRHRPAAHREGPGTPVGPSGPEAGQVPEGPQERVRPAPGGQELEDRGHYLLEPHCSPRPEGRRGHGHPGGSSIGAALRPRHTARSPLRQRDAGRWLLLRQEPGARGTGREGARHSRRDVSEAPVGPSQRCQQRRKNMETRARENGAGWRRSLEAPAQNHHSPRESARRGAPGLGRDAQECAQK